MFSGSCSKALRNGPSAELMSPCRASRTAAATRLEFPPDAPQYDQIIQALTLKAQANKIFAIKLRRFRAESCLSLEAFFAPTFDLRLGF